MRAWTYRRDTSVSALPPSPRMRRQPEIWDMGWRVIWDGAHTKTHFLPWCHTGCHTAIVRNDFFRWYFQLLCMFSTFIPTSKKSTLYFTYKTRNSPMTYTYFHGYICFDCIISYSYWRSALKKIHFFIDLSLFRNLWCDTRSDTSGRP